jgi:hypothetical protein
VAILPVAEEYNQSTQIGTKLRPLISTMDVSNKANAISSLKEILWIA